MKFSIKTQQFEGPLDLLIDLIEKRRLLVNDFAIAAVTDEYLAFVSKLEQYSVKDATQFIALAATLLLIKSKSLLPVFEMTKDEVEATGDLEERLRVYQIFRSAAKVLAQRFDSAPLYVRGYVPEKSSLFIVDTYTEKNQLAEAMHRVLSRIPKKVVAPLVRIKKTVSLEEVMENLKERMTRQMKLSFSDFIGERPQRTVKIVSFLAVLEMVRGGHVQVAQQTTLGDIHIHREAHIETPKFF